MLNLEKVEDICVNAKFSIYSLFLSLSSFLDVTYASIWTSVTVLSTSEA